MEEIWLLLFSSPVNTPYRVLAIGSSTNQWNHAKFHIAIAYLSSFVSGSSSNPMTNRRHAYAVPMSLLNILSRIVAIRYSFRAAISPNVSAPLSNVSLNRSGSIIASNGLSPPGIFDSPSYISRRASSFDLFPTSSSSSTGNPSNSLG